MHDLSLSNTIYKSPKCTFRGLVFSYMVFGFLLCIGCKSKTREVLQYFEDGSVSRRHFEIDGKKQGLMTDYYSDGSVQGERHFVDDLQEGRTVWYYPDGGKKETQYFSKGIQIGPDSIWMENGALQRVILFENGKKNGPMRAWSETGDLILEVIYQNDSLVNVIKTNTSPDTLSRTSSGESARQ